MMTLFHDDGGKGMQVERSLLAIRESARHLSQTIDDAQALSDILRVAAQAVDASGGAIWEHVPLDNSLACRHAFGAKADSMVGFVLRDDEGIAGQCFQDCRARSDESVYLSADYASRVDKQHNFRTDSMITLPLLFPGGAPVGVIQLVNKQEGPFSADDQDLLESIASVTAMRLHVAELARMAARTAALDYVGHFAHDIYNRLQSSYTGVPQFQEEVEAQARKWDEVYPDLNATARMEFLSDLFLKSVGDDAKLIFRYMRFIVQLVKTGEPVDADFQTRNAVEVIKRQIGSLRLMADERNTSVTWAVEGGDEEGTLRADFDDILLGSAVYNLIKNALTETRDGKVSVIVRATPDHFMEVQVTDTGRGMPPIVLESILTGDPISTRREGTGLGTLIIKRVAERHGGSLYGHSTQGKGTTFIVRIPLTQSRQ